MFNKISAIFVVVLMAIVMILALVIIKTEYIDHNPLWMYSSLDSTLPPVISVRHNDGQWSVGWLNWQGYYEVGTVIWVSSAKPVQICRNGLIEILESGEKDYVLELPTDFCVTHVGGKCSYACP